MTSYHNQTGVHVGGYRHSMEHNLTISKGGLIDPGTYNHKPTHSDGNKVDGYHYRGTNTIDVNG